LLLQTFFLHHVPAQKGPSESAQRKMLFIICRLPLRWAVLKESPYRENRQRDATRASRWACS